MMPGQKLSTFLSTLLGGLRETSGNNVAVACKAIQSLSFKQNFSTKIQQKHVCSAEVRPHHRINSNVLPISKGSTSMDNDSATFQRLNARSRSRAKVATLSTAPNVRKNSHRCFIAIGSNMGDRLGNIERACQILSLQDKIRLVRTSGLWQTEAMYVEDQDQFLNGVLEIQTELEPLKLLDKLQEVENALGRKRLIDKGPRTLDLDILLYDDAVIKSERLIVPHPLMLEREFVLQPLCQLIPDESLPGAPGSNFATHLLHLPKTDRSMSTYVQLTKSMKALTPYISSKSTLLMSILNITPDSFSDGGLLSLSKPEALRNTIEAHITDGATILDVGGESTRPKANAISEAEEISRVIPTIQLIKSITDAEGNASNVAISIDTYHASVARAAVKAGAHIINDISGGTLDPEMLPTAAELGCPIILMHMRGNPSTMMSESNTSYPHGLLNTIGRELLMRVKAAENAGVRRWNIILDPGIGFAKNKVQNLEILKKFHELKNFTGLEGFPWLIGASRKRFIGTVTGVKEASERTWGTAVTVAASIQGGADIVRVHDVQEMQKIIAMSDAIWRQTS